MIVFLISVVVVVALIFVLIKINKGKNSKCANCKAKLSYPDDFKLYYGPERSTIKQTKEGKPYTEYYQNVIFEFNCTKCKKSYTKNHDFVVNRSDNATFRSPEEIKEYLKKRVPQEFEKGVFTKEPEFLTKQ